MKKIMNIYRQGDLLLYPLKEKPKNLKLVFKGKKYVLKYGEATGHKHLLVVEPTKLFEILEDEKGQKYIKLSHSGKIVHEEHKTLTIMPDFYVVHEEREYDYPEQEINKVVD